MRLDGIPCRDTITAENDPNPDQLTEYKHKDPVDAKLVTEVVYPDGGVVLSSYNVDGTLREKTA